MEKFNVQVNAILLALQTKLADTFGALAIDRKTVLQLSKELGYLQGKRGREGGTFATETGMAFANLSGEIIRPMPRAERLALVADACCAVPCEPCATDTQVVSVSEVP